MEIVIEKNVPRTVGHAGKWAQAEAALAKMGVGDSFLFPSSGVPSPLYGAAKRVGVKVSVGKVADGQYRVWRKA